MKTVTISLLVMTHNRPQHARAAIASALDQKAGDYQMEIVLLDNGSERPIDDDFVDRRLRLIRSDRNLGVPGGRNLLAQRATGDWLLYLDDDARLADPFLLGTLADYVRNRPQLLVVACNVVELRKPGVRYLPFDRQTVKRLDLSRPRRCAYFVGGAHVIRRRAFERVAGYRDKLFFGGEELDLSYRLLNAGGEMHYHPELLVVHDSADQRPVGKRRRAYLTLRNKVYLNHAYLPRRYRYLSDAIWVGLSLWGNRELGATFRALREGLKMGDGCTPLSPTAIAYLRANHGRLVY